MEEIKMNEKAVERLKRKIILQENQNLKTRTLPSVPKRVY